MYGNNTEVTSTRVKYTGGKSDDGMGVRLVYAIAELQEIDEAFELVQYLAFKLADCVYQ